MDEDAYSKVDNFFRQFKHQIYKKGELLIRADDDPTGIFYLKVGIVKMYLISQKGEEIVLNTFKPISFFPMSWAINSKTNEYFYEAVTELSVWRAPKDEVIAFIKSEPDVLYDLLSRVYKGTDGLLLRMRYLMAGSAYSNLILELIINAKRFGKEINGQIFLKVSEKDLAAQTGMARETVSREMKTLKDKGLVSFQKNTIAINALNRLEEELSKIV